MNDDITQFKIGEKFNYIIQAVPYDPWDGSACIDCGIKIKYVNCVVIPPTSQYLKDNSDTIVRISCEFTEDYYPDKGKWEIGINSIHKANIIYDDILEYEKFIN